MGFFSRNRYALQCAPKLRGQPNLLSSLRLLATVIKYKAEKILTHSIIDRFVNGCIQDAINHSLLFRENASFVILDYHWMLI